MRLNTDICRRGDVQTQIVMVRLNTPSDFAQDHMCSHALRQYHEI